MLLVKRLLQGLMEYADTGNFPVKPGVLRDHEGNPLLDVVSLEGATDDSPGSARAWARTILELCAAGRMDLVDAHINSMGGLQCALFSYPTGTAVLTPSVSTVLEIPFAIIALCRSIPVDDRSNDSLAHRVAKCEQCGKFFLRKTVKKSRFHNRACRIRFMNVERLKSGYFADYYRKKKSESK